jgi:dTDP-4-amino-4,6-dideoxygalactose transaminase
MRLEIAKEARKRIDQRYRMNLANTKIKFQEYSHGTDITPWSFPLQFLNPMVDSTLIGERMLRNFGIEIRTGFQSSNNLHYLTKFNLPVSDYLSKSTISLPTYELLNDNTIDYICESLLSLL